MNTFIIYGSKKTKRIFLQLRNNIIWKIELNTVSTHVKEHNYRRQVNNRLLRWRKRAGGLTFVGLSPLCPNMELSKIPKKINRHLMHALSVILASVDHQSTPLIVPFAIAVI